MLRGSQRLVVVPDIGKIHKMRYLMVSNLVSGMDDLAILNFRR